MKLDIFKFCISHRHLDFQFLLKTFRKLATCCCPQLARAYQWLPTLVTGTHTRPALIYLISLTHAPSYPSIRIASGQDEAKETGVEEGALISTIVSALVYLQTRKELDLV